MFSEFLALLGLAVFLLSVFRRIKLPAVLAYLVCGVVLGPYAMAVVTDQHQVQLIAELGLVFLMFSLGLEFSLPKMIAMRKLVFGLGGSQVLFSVLFFTVGGLAFGLTWQQAVVIAGALAMSSTAVVIKELSEQKKLNSHPAMLCVSVLLFQDLAVVPLLVMIPILASPDQNQQVMILAITWAIFKGGITLVTLLAVGKWLLPRFFHEIARARSDELFVLSTLFVALLTAALTHLLGLSMALGAFLAGMMLGESNYRHHLESDIRPFRDVLMGLFFTTIGMQIDLLVFFQNLPLIVSVAAAIIFVKVTIIGLAAILQQERPFEATSAGIMISQIGEFGFVLFAMASQHGLITNEQASILIGMGVLSIAATPWLIGFSGTIASKIIKQRAAKMASMLENAAQERDLHNHVIICGFGRVGQSCARFLKLENIQHIAIDLDPQRVQAAQAAEECVEFGDVCRREILTAAGIERCRLMIITFDDLHHAQATLELARELAPTLKILVRTRDDQHLTELKEKGATEVIPESLEGALMLVSQVLGHCQVPHRRILARMDHERSNHYTFLHGFYWGGHPNISLDNDAPVERLHAVTIEENAYAIGKTLEEMAIPLGSIREIHRSEQVLHPIPILRIEAHDIVILFGASEVVEEGEHKLLEG